MNYQEFLEYIKNNLPELMNYKLENQNEENKETESSRNDSCEENLYEAELYQVIKNNGIVLDGITLRKHDEAVTPTIYLNSYFESYQMGKPIAVIMEEIICCYQHAKEDIIVESVDVTDFKEIRNQIILRIVNYDKNKEQLKGCPHKKYLDLAVTFRLIAGKDSLGMASSMVSNQEFDAWKIDLEELYQIALFNTMREFSWQMEPLANIVIDCLKRRLPEALTKELEEEMQILEDTKNGVNMFVLTNDVGINGATCMLYDNVLRNFARVQDSNIFILPSSIHEVMLVPETEETDPEFLTQLVADANQTAVGLIDLLSDNIYYYDRSREQIYIYGQN